MIDYLPHKTQGMYVLYLIYIKFFSFFARKERATIIMQYSAIYTHEWSCP
jgi:hypothetical protein